MKNPFFVLFLFFISSASFSQNDSVKKPFIKGSFYFSFGYTKCAYSKSTIHFEDHSGKMRDNNTDQPTDYDFTIYNVKASDRPDYDKIPDIIKLKLIL